MRELIKMLASSWHKKPGATALQIGQAEEILSVSFPEDYKAFLLWSNGGEGRIGDMYFSLWSAQEIARLNEDYMVNRYLPGVIGIGTDGGVKCYAFDYHTNPTVPPFVRVPLGDLDFASIVVLGRTFREAMERAINA